MGIVDFQDALWGPITYDVVSLLRDCYLRWPDEQVRQWALGYGNMAADAGLLADVDELRYLRWFDWMGLQRHLKVLGVFSRLSLRDGKHHYLADLPLVIRYVLEVSQRYPELRNSLNGLNNNCCLWPSSNLGTTTTAVPEIAPRESHDTGCRSGQAHAPAHGSHPQTAALRKGQTVAPISPGSPG